MEDRNLSLLAVGCSLLGIVLLYFASQGIKPEKVELSDIDEDYLGEFVEVSGVVFKVRDSKGHLFVWIYDRGYIEIPLFSSMRGDLQVEIGDFVDVLGVVDRYKDELQIRVSKVEDVRIYKPIYGWCENREFKIKEGIEFSIEEDLNGFCGLIGESKDGSFEILKVLDLEFTRNASSKNLGKFYHFSSRITYVRNFGEFQVVKLFSEDVNFLFYENLRIAHKVSGFGILCEKDGYFDVFPLYYELSEIPKEKIAFALRHEEGFPVKTSGFIVYLKQYADSTYAKVRDNSGSVYVYLPKDNSLREGYSIQFSGILREKRIYVKDEKNVEIESKSYTIIPIEEITEDYLGDKVAIKGEIVEMSISKDGHLFLILRDETGSITVPIFSNMAKDFKEKGLDVYSLKIGMKIVVFGAVELYQGAFEVIAEVVTLG
ncbi:MAG: exodeoxyribonuclease VII large subunit [Candidatus Methanofastidiosia archaeon]